jgi:hypothetical protein
MKMISGSGDGHVEQAPLFLETFAAPERHV